MPNNQDSNALGLAGFIVSVVGFCSGGILSPIGLILSLVALANQPRGFAIAGVVIGALGSCGILIGLLLILLVPVVFVGILGAAGLAAATGLLTPEAEMTVEMLAIREAADRHIQIASAPPLSIYDLDELPDPFRLDPWNNEYQIHPLSESVYVIVSLGEDGLPGTNDDFYLEPGKDTITDGSGWRILINPEPIRVP